MAYSGAHCSAPRRERQRQLRDDCLIEHGFVSLVQNEPLQRQSRRPLATASSFFEWLNTSPWANFINGNEWAFPAVECLHLMGFALSIGTIAMVDLRLLGLAMRRRTAAELAADLDGLTWLGLAVMLTTGPLMFSADAVAWHRNPAFQFKMVGLALALAFHFTLHRRATRPGTPPLLAQLAGSASLALWAAVVGSGRMIAFT
jgi:hypothetical protein